MGRQIDPTWVNETETRASERDDLLIYHHHIEPRRALFPDPRVPDSVAGDMGDDVTATGNIVEGSSVGAGSGTPPGVPGGGGGGFRIPKVASSQAPGAGGGSAASPAAGAPAPPPRPPADPSHPPAFPPGAPRDDRYDRGPSGATATTAAAADEDRKRRVHKGTRRHRHMLVLDLNGLLVDRRMSPFENPVDGTKVAPDAKFGKFYIYNRPHMQSFVEWASEHFTVGVWSSAQHHNARTLVNHIWGKQRDRLAFVWGQDRCTHVGAMDPAAGPGHGLGKPILLKDLHALWAVSSYARFGPNNTLLLDDSPYKAVMNPAHTAIHPAEYKLSWGGADVNVTGEESDANDHRRIADELLGPSGALRTYLAKLSECETVTAYVAANPWRSFGPAAPDSDPGLMAKAREGGEAVAAAAAATATAGVDANEIDLGEFSDDEGREEAKGEVGGSTPRRVDRDPIDPDGWGGSGDEAEGDARSNGGVGTKREAPEAGTNAVDASRKPGKKPKRVFTGSGASLFIRRWAWKREAKTDEERFVLPYEHEWLGTKMSFAQRRFDDGGASGGFASTVWDSSIVLAKYVEKHRGSFANKKVCELGAGCGVVSAALVKAGCARVVATDLPENLPLLRENMERNCGGGENGRGGEGARWEVKALTWGADAAVALGETFDVVVAADCMYIAEAASDLVDTLAALVPAGGESPGPGSLPPALMSYGRNRQAEDEFLAACDGAKSGKARTLTIEDVAESELDELYQCSDVRVVNVLMR